MDKKTCELLIKILKDWHPECHYELKHSCLPSGQSRTYWVGMYHGYCHSTLVLVNPDGKIVTYNEELQALSQKERRALEIIIEHNKPAPRVVHIPKISFQWPISIKWISKQLPRSQWIK